MFPLAHSLAFAMAIASSTPAATLATGDAQAAATEKKICKYVVASNRGAKPYELCMTKAEWAAKSKADAKDANRTVCRYQEIPGDRFRSRKLCMSAAEWENQRQLERQAVERIQSGVCVPGAGC